MSMTVMWRKYLPYLSETWM